MTMIERKKLEMVIKALSVLTSDNWVDQELRGEAWDACKEALTSTQCEKAAAVAALKLALEAFNSGADVKIGRVVWTEYDSCLIADAITAIKEALALTSTQCEKQPVQEPVADAFMVHLYNLGYKSGHHDTVEGQYIDIFRQDMDTYHSDVVFDWLKGVSHATPPTPQQQEPRNFCPRCGKRTADLTVIHTCTPPEGGHQ